MAKTKQVNDLMASAYTDLLAGIDKKFNLSAGDFSPLKLSTGVLAVDYICNGGLVPGMTTMSGFEGSSKSTLVMETLGQGLKSSIPILRVDDAENTFDGSYTSNIIGQPIAPLLPRYTKGKLINSPRVWYSQNNIIETYYDSLVQTFSRLPDKLYSKDAKAWFYVVDKKNKHHENFLKAFKELKADSNLSRGEKLFYPASNTAPQGVFFLDSYPTMVTNTQAEKQEANNMPTAPAIAFAQNIPRITGFFKRKSIILLAVNQMRKRPGMAFGNPNYEARGETIKLWSNNRMLLTSRAVHKDWKKPDATTSDYIEEPSVEYKGKSDHYAFKHIKNIKLKHGTPYLECWSRIWIKNGQKPGQGMGFDKAFDTYEYMRLNDLASIEGKGNKMNITFAELGDKKTVHPLSKRTMKWLQFKILILDEVLANKTEYFQEQLKQTMSELKLKDKPRLREWCANHLASQTKV